MTSRWSQLQHWVSKTFSDPKQGADRSLESWDERAWADERTRRSRLPIPCVCPCATWGHIGICTGQRGSNTSTSQPSAICPPCAAAIGSESATPINTPRGTAE